MNDLVQTGPSSDDRNLAMLAHLLGMFFSVIPSLIIWLMKKDESQFIAQEAREALNFQITIAIGFAIAHLTLILGIGFLLWLVLIVFNFISCIVAALAVSKGQHYRYPFAIRLVS